MWANKPLRSLCEAVVDCPHSTPTWTEDGVVVLRNQNIRNGRLDLRDASYTDEWHYIERTRRAVPSAGDLVITREAPMGEVCMLPEGLRCCLGQRMVLVRPNAKVVEPRYLLYALQSKVVQDEIRSHDGTGSTVSNLRIPLLEGLPIPAPPLHDQQWIAHILGTLDDKIDLNRRTSETLEAMAMAMFQSWFVDFEPVRRTEASLPRELRHLFPREFQQSQIGEIPTGWRLTPLPVAINVNPPRHLRRGDLAPYLDMANMPTTGHSAHEVVERPFGSGMRFINGDTLVARITPCLENGKTAYVDFLQEGQIGWGSTEYIVLCPKQPLPSEFSYCLARSDRFRDFAIQSMTGSSGRQRVPAESLFHFLIPMPTPEVAELFGRIVKPMFRRAAVAARESRTLAAIRDALLPKLISGELRVKDAKKAVEALA